MNGSFQSSRVRIQSPSPQRKRNSASRTNERTEIVSVLQGGMSMWKAARSFIAAAVAAAGLVITYTPVSAQPPPPCDFVSSGGFIITQQGAEGNFGADGGCKNGAFWGHVNYVDHGGSWRHAVPREQHRGYGAISRSRRTCATSAASRRPTPMKRSRSVSVYGWSATERLELRRAYLASVFPTAISSPCVDLGDGGPGGGSSSSINPIILRRRRSGIPTKPPCAQAWNHPSRMLCVALTDVRRVS